MDCRRCQSLLPEYVLDHLTEDERDRVTHHLAGGCDECRRSLLDVGETWVLLADALPPASVPSHIDAAICSRIAQGGAASDDRRPVIAAFSPEQDELALGDRRSFPRLAAVLAATILVALTIGGVAWLSYSRGRLDEWQETARRAGDMERLQSELSQADELFKGGRLHFASLRDTGPGSTVRGYVVWDRMSRQVHFYVFDLPLLPEGRAWHIWLLGQDMDPIPAGMLEPQAGRAGSILIDVPSELGDKFRVAVVEGPQETSPAPAAEPWLTTDVE